MCLRDMLWWSRAILVGAAGKLLFDLAAGICRLPIRSFIAANHFKREFLLLLRLTIRVRGGRILTQRSLKAEVSRVGVRSWLETVEGCYRTCRGKGAGKVTFPHPVFVLPLIIIRGCCLLLFAKSNAVRVPCFKVVIKHVFIYGLEAF